MHKLPLLLGEIVQRGVKAYFPKDIEEEIAFYELKFTRGNLKVLEHHKLRASMYKWLSNTEHSYLLYCLPRGFKEFEVNDEFSEKHAKSLMDK
ncbi:MAG: hypothetical protein QW046_03145 [Candidatus Micrarchaeaceae archaeon]